MNAYVSTPSQWGTGSAFYHGHTVLASTPFNVLNAGGAYTVQCNHPATLPMTGERALRRSTTYGFDRNQLTVTIPAQQPALRNVSGWLQVPGNTHTELQLSLDRIRDGGWLLHRLREASAIRSAMAPARDGGTVDFQDIPPIQGRRRRRLHSLIVPVLPFHQYQGW